MRCLKLTFVLQRHTLWVLYGHVLEVFHDQFKGCLQFFLDLGLPLLLAYGAFIEIVEHLPNILYEGERRLIVSLGQSLVNYLKAEFVFKLPAILIRERPLKPDSAWIFSQV